MPCIALLLLVSSPVSAAPASTETSKPAKGLSDSLELELFAAGYEKPLQIVTPVEASEPPYVVEQTGAVVSLNPDKAKRVTILDLKEEVVLTDEAGLLGFAFHPEFAVNHFAYAHYIGKSREKENRISEFHISGGVPSGANDERRMIRLLQKNLENLGGQIAFGPDKNLYISIGDGDGQTDSENRGQNQNDQFANILRIGVAEETSTNQPYLAPVDNPYVANGLGHRDVWAVGLRNPRTFTFDPETKNLFVGDAGTGIEQEVDLVRAGGNYGWSVFDGIGCLRMRFECMNQKYSSPIVSYLKTSGTAVSVGFVYDGDAIASLKGALLYGDKKSGRLWALKYSGGKLISNDLILETGKEISCFGQTPSGEPLLADYKTGAIYQLVMKK